jgi:hypothetical protein
MKKITLTATLIISALCSGCGLNGMQAAQYKRTESVEKIASILVNAKTIDMHLINDLEAGKKSVKMLAGQASNQPSNVIIRDLDGRLKTMTTAEDHIIVEAKKALKENSEKFGISESKILKEAINEDSGLSNSINREKARYLVNVRSYNDIIGVFPANVTAKMIREEPRVALSIDGIDTGKDNAGKLSDAAIAKQKSE